MFWFLVHAIGAPLYYGFPNLIGTEIRLDRPTLAFDYRVIEQITEPWVLDLRLGKSCVLKDVQIRPRSIEFSFRTDLKWSDGTTIPGSFLMDQFRRLVREPHFEGLLVLKEAPLKWSVSWPDSAHTIAYSLQRSEFGLIHESNRKLRPWSELGPTFGPYRIETRGKAVQLVPNSFYPAECGKPTETLEFVASNRENPTSEFLAGKVDVLQMDSDRAKDSEIRELIEHGSTSIGLGSSAVWTAVIFGTESKHSDRIHWSTGLKKCVKEKKNTLISGHPLEIVVSKIFSTSRTLRELGDCFGEKLKISFVEPDAFSHRRLSGLVPTFNQLGLRFPDPDDKWVFLREHYPNLKSKLITEKRLAEARIQRKKGTLTGYNAFDKANERDPWIILLNNVKTQLFLRKGLKFRSESDSILRLGGIYE